MKFKCGDLIQANDRIFATKNNHNKLVTIQFNELFMILSLKYKPINGNYKFTVLHNNSILKIGISIRRINELMNLVK